MLTEVCLSALTALGLLIQMWFTPLFVWGFLPAPLLWLSYVYLFRETTRSTASPLRVVETFCLGLVLDVPVVLAQVRCSISLVLRRISIFYCSFCFVLGGLVRFYERFRQRVPLVKPKSKYI